MSDYISEDSIVQILKWLPVNPLVRFRSVCKLWKQIIDSQLFIQEHLSLQKPRFLVEYLFKAPDLLVVDLHSHTIPSAEALLYPFEVNPERGRLCLVNTHHGVVLLYNNVSKRFVLWNPTIRKFFSLSLPRIMDFEWRDPLDRLIPAHSSLWIDPSDNSFKIIAFKLYSGSVDDHQADKAIYSSIERTWKVLPVGDFRSYTPFLLPDIIPPVMVMIGGVAYWRACSKPTTTPFQGDQRYFTTFLVSFDFVRERFEIIEAPQLRHMHYTGFCHPLHCNFQGTLSLVYWDEYDPFRCDIYSRREGEWVNMFRFIVVVPSFITVLWSVEVIQGRCRVVAESGIECEDVSLVAYDGQLITLKSGLGLSGLIHMAYDFVESLVFPSS